MIFISATLTGYSSAGIVLHQLLANCLLLLAQCCNPFCLLSLLPLNLNCRFARFSCPPPGKLSYSLAPLAVIMNIMPIICIWNHMLIFNDWMYLTLSTPTFLNEFWRILKLLMNSCSSFASTLTFFIIKQPEKEIYPGVSFQVHDNVEI